MMRTFEIYFLKIQYSVINVCVCVCGLPGGSAVKNSPVIQETWETQAPSLGSEDPLEKEMATHSVFLPGKSHGQRSLAGYSPWVHKELYMTLPR